ncbi:STT3 domain-containing protein [Helicobacter sp. MIT 14-3879]|uniref:STT3 domain-containing protein n=1 Tax=Helicobacter sp. MIT 14-3879 TaxID=2040649 RepID=UPI000E1E8A20|nr:STT3 domain-containing protein [Helicobacter sp. MIT 14-3879]RDU60932.1 hypothetical protein CQA44_09910 [Helicobacter sp. MIT 14-3879]
MINKIRNIDKYLLLDLAFILIAIFIAIYTRYIFVDYTQPIKSYFFNGERILTTNDAYHFATATRDFINKHFGDDAFYPLASYELPSLLSAAVYYIFPISISSLFFLMPIFVSSLFAIPIYLITKELSNRYIAFFASLLAPMTQGYVNRTSAGYYDTDMLVLTLPLFGVYFLFRILKYNNFRDVVFAIIFFILSLMWHKVSATYILGTSIFIAIIYVIAIERKNIKLFESLGVLIIAISFINIFLKLFLILLILHFMSNRVLIFNNLTQSIKSKLKYQSLLIFLIAISVLLVANMDLIISRLSTYITGNMVESSIAIKSTHGTILELQPLSFANLVERVIGDYISFSIASIGIILVFIKQPKTLILLPFLILSLLSMKIGMRFAMFGAPIFSIGFFYLIYFVTLYLKRIFNDKIVIDTIKAAILCAFGYLAIIPNYYYTINFLLPPISYTGEIQALDSINKDSKNKRDITISWWDYGFMIPYYSNTHSLISGTDLDGINHFIASKILVNTNQISSYNLAKMVSDIYFTKDNNLIKLNILDRILQKYNTKGNEEVFFNSLSKLSFKDIKTNDVYIYLPNSILPITTVIEQFSDIDFKSGKPTYNVDDRKLVQYNSISKEGINYKLNDSYIFNPNRGTLLSTKTNNILQFQKFHIIERKNGALKTTTKSYNDDKSNLHIIYSKELGAFFAIDERTNNSLIVQLFIYENYDKNLFELLYTSTESKAYKLK